MILLGEKILWLQYLYTSGRSVNFDSLYTPPSFRLDMQVERSQKPRTAEAKESTRSKRTSFVISKGRISSLLWVKITTLLSIFTFLM